MAFPPIRERDMEQESHIQFFPLRKWRGDDRWVAMRLSHVQETFFELSAADAMLMATSIRDMVAYLFGTQVEAGAETGQTSITVSADRSVVQIEFPSEMDGVRGLVMQPEGWLWFADRLENSSSLASLPGSC
jgi:hypothetical protein